MFKKETIFSSYAVDNVEQAKEFYTTVLGLEVQEDPMGFMELHIPGSNNVLLYPRDNHRPAPFTVLNLPVKDIDEAVNSLIEKGVRFEQYEGNIATDPKGICRANGQGPDIAWFKDPAGNILSVLVL
ncbi:VOC family protein [Planktosalinus lacus]|uniref:Glyoxalase n=1 Tax=Planktosalinus lacus TaxID=1526573 RepID=A0A8J2VEQ0_9FLAO|nr:VOC family protein [Planktosalinus lacus]GGD99907.1 glyoxalase [Planktosalinus lacus]